MVGSFVEVCRGRSLKVNAGKSKLMLVSGEEGFQCEVCVDWMRLEHLLNFKYLWRVLRESITNEAECRRKVARGRSVAVVIRSLVNARGLELQWARVLHQSLLLPIIMYSSETLVWKEKGRSRIIAVQMDKLRGLLGIRRMDKDPNAHIWELYGVMKELDKRIVEGILRWFGHVDRRANDTVAKRF